MTSKKRKKLKSWIFIYAAMIAAVVFTTQSGAQTPRESTNVSPVNLGGDAPALTLISIVRRSDI